MWSCAGRGWAERKGERADAAKRQGKEAARGRGEVWVKKGGDRRLA